MDPIRECLSVAAAILRSRLGPASVPVGKFDVAPRQGMFRIRRKILQRLIEGHLTARRPDSKPT